MSILDLANPFHAYTFGTAFWYFLRGMCRIIDPVAVSGWFRPPVQGDPIPNDLELYNIWTDGWGLLTLAFILILISDAVPLPGSLTGSALVEPTSTKAKKPYARGVVLITIFHHVTTAYGAFQHWVQPTHRTVAMDIGVWFNVFLTVAGVVALVYGLGDGGAVTITGKKRV